MGSSLLMIKKLDNDDLQLLKRVVSKYDDLCSLILGRADHAILYQFQDDEWVIIALLEKNKDRGFDC